MARRWTVNGPLESNPRIDLRARRFILRAKRSLINRSTMVSSSPTAETWQYSISHRAVRSPRRTAARPPNLSAIPPIRIQPWPGLYLDPARWHVDRTHLATKSSVWVEPAGANNPYVKTEFTSIRDGGGNLSKTAIKDYNYDKNGNVTQVREYDWVRLWQRASVERISIGHSWGRNPETGYHQ